MEESKAPADLLAGCRSLLAQNGHLILGAENRFAIKYFCGDSDPYTNHVFDGIENYGSLTPEDRDKLAGRCYTKAELQEKLAAAGFLDNKFYTLLPSLQETQLVYAEEFEPSEDLSMRYFSLYRKPDSIFLGESSLYSALIKNGMFHQMANAYVIDCSTDGSHDNTLHATISLDRGKENALVTSIYEKNGDSANLDIIDECVKKYGDKATYGEKNWYVCKRAVYPQGNAKLMQMQANLDTLSERGVNVVPSHIEGDCLVMPYVDAPVAMNALKEVAKRDKGAYLSALEDMHELIMQSSDYTDVISEKDLNSANGADIGTILERGYIDMVPLNCFYDERIENPKDRFIYYDQEFYWENCPANAIMHRSLAIIHNNSDRVFEEIVSKKEDMDRYGLSECDDMWKRMSDRFIDKLRNQTALASYFLARSTNVRIIYTNRENINYGAKEYHRIFYDIFDGCDAPDGTCCKKIVIFGSGKFTHKFMLQFGGDYPIYSIVDNDSSKWGSRSEGIPVNSPDILRDIADSERHVIICIRNYSDVVKQLTQMGITNYHIYDPGNDYPNKRRQMAALRMALNAHGLNDGADLGNTGDGSKCGGEELNKSDKPYNVGYIAGVFDLFHIGHLNLFRRAKEMCRYLIVGVVSDEAVRINKQAEPYIPFDERIEIVRSCRYVDEAVKLPLDFCGTKDMYKIYHFDVQFSGSDYENDQGWLSEKEFLESNGSTLVFFPYTQSTSSTKLKKAISEH